MQPATVKLWGSALAGTLAALALNAWSLPPGGHYADSGLPMLLTADSYFFLDQALRPATPLGHLLAGTVSLTGLSPNAAANLLTWLMPFCLLLWNGAWAALLRLGPLPTLFFALTAGISPAWIARCGPGTLDTDPGIAWFWQGLLWAASLALIRPQKRLPALACLLLCGLALSWWWLPGFGLLAMVLFWLIFFLLPGRWRLIWFGSCLALGAAFFLLPDALFPLAGARLYALDHLRLVLGLKQGLIFQSIGELSTLNPAEWLRQLGGSPAGGMLALAGLTAFYRRPRLPLLLISAVSLLALGMVADRFLYLAAPLCALGLALWLNPAPGLPGQTWLPRLAALLFALSLGWGLMQRDKEILFLQEHDESALALASSAPPGAPLWAWWDDAYFLRARSGLAPYFDGGSQTQEAAWTVAHPLAQPDPLLARRWIRFFALRGQKALEPLHTAWGEDLWQNLEALFVAPDPAVVLRQLPPLPPSCDATTWLFPQGRVFLYLNQRFLKLSGWWLALGEDRNAASPRGNAVAIFPRQGFHWDASRRTLALPAAAKTYEGQINDVHNLSVTPLTPPWQEGVHLVLPAASPWVYVVNGEGLRSLAFRLYAAREAMPGFSPLSGNTLAAAWEVKAE